MRHYALGAALLLLLSAHDGAAQCSVPSVTTASGTHAPARGSTICPGDLLFEDTFDALDTARWQHENTLAGGGNWEFQWYTNDRRNTFVRDGVLYIKPTLTSDTLGGEDQLYSATVDLNGGAPADYCTNAANYGCIRTGTADNPVNVVRSGRLRTVDSFSFRYGKVEIRAKTPRGDWLWPAIWMMPRYNAYGGWPASGEIDIMESRGNPNLMLNNQNIGTQQMGSTLHWGPDFWNNRYPLTHYEKNNVAGYDQAFHTYGIEWTPEELRFYVDSQLLGTVRPPAGGFWELGNLAETGASNPWAAGSPMAPFDQEFYLILNNAVGGTAYFPDEASNPGGKPWSNTSPTAMRDFWAGKDAFLPGWNLQSSDAASLQVDYVRVWAL